MVDQGDGYDTDTISLTSTVESRNDGVYEVEGILSEGLNTNRDGSTSMKYLIEWTGYPMHQCTWEPEDGLLSAGVLEPWTKKKARMSKRDFAKYTVKKEKLFSEAVSQYEDSKALRKQKRAKRRNKVKQRNKICVDDDSKNDSEDDILQTQQKQSRQREDEAVEPIPTHSQQIYNSLFVDSQDIDPLGPPPSLGRSDDGPSVTQRPVHRKAPLEQSTDDEEDANSSEVSVDSLMGELADKAQRKVSRQTTSKSQANKEINLGTSILSSKSPKQQAKSLAAKPTTTSGTAKAQGPGQSHVQPPKLQRTLTAPIKPTIALLAGVTGKERRPSEPSAQVSVPVSARAANAVTPETSTCETAVASTSNLLKSTAATSTQNQSRSVAAPVSRKNGAASKASNPIRITNEPKAALRKEWNTKDTLYGKLKFRGRAEKRSEREGTPDINVLEFVGAAPTGSIPAKSKRSDLVDDPYARRETRNRRVQEADGTGKSRRGSFEEDLPVEKRYPGKVPLICAKDRLSRDCQLGPEKCRFIHDDRSDLPVGDMGGYIPPKFRIPPVTCPYWLRKEIGCMKPDNQCDFAHRNTGWIPSTTMNAQPIPCDPKEISRREQIVSQIMEDNNTTPKNAQTSNRPPLANNAGPPTKPKYTTGMDKTCWYWANAKCDKPDALCKFKHYDTGVVAKLGKTCKFWEKGRCAFTAEQCKYSHGEPWQSGVNHDARFSNTEHEMLAHSHVHDAASTPPRTIESPPLPLGQVRVSPGVVSTSSVTERPIPTSVLVTKPPAAASKPRMSQAMEKALGFNFEDLFSWGDDGNGTIMLERRAFLIYHPEDHLKELDMMTRCLLGHHVATASAWFEGSWQQYAQEVVRKGSGVIFVHPDFEYFTELKDFGKVLLKQVRVWSFGFQEGIEYDPALSHLPSDKQHHCIELFPVGGFIYITDDVFEAKPRLAFNIIKLFLAKIEGLRPGQGSESRWQEVDNINLHWRLCVRPELMEYLFDKCEEQGKALEAGDPDVQAWAELYTLLSDTNYIEQDSPILPLSLKADKFPIMSERRNVAEEEPVDYFNSLARSREKANLRMIRYYAGLHVDSRRDYRHFYIIHTDCSGSCVQQWQREVQTLTEIMTPEKCIEELSKTDADENDQKFDFYERYLLEGK